MDSVLILDFGSQYTQLIARRIRELGVYSEIRPYSAEPVKDETFGAIILSGGPSSVTEEGAPEFNESWLEQGVPVLGICYGMQAIAHHFGASLAGGEKREYGHAELEIVDASGIFENFSKTEKTGVWMSHGDHIETLPDGFTLYGKSSSCPVAAFGNPEKRIFGIQFHPEVAHTPCGKELLSNFIFQICGLKGDWTPESFTESTVAKIRAEVGEDANVICGLSGGVDSTVAAVLVEKAIENRLHCIFVDNGLLRKDEAEQVEKRMSGLGLNVLAVNAGPKFIKELAGVTDPEKKRKIIGRVFIEVFEEEARKIPNVTHLVQGTLYPDVIESVSVRGPSDMIKSHHNVGGLPENMAQELIEPLRELFKDEVRELGRSLSIPRPCIVRQPFPGPGLAVRILGEITEERISTLQEADAIFLEEIREGGIYEELWQSFAVLLPIQSVGVMGDLRTYEQTVALRAVTSEDGMTADWAYLPQDLLRRTSNRIINEVKGVNRVVLDISSKPPSTIEWE